MYMYMCMYICVCGCKYVYACIYVCECMYHYQIKDIFASRGGGTGATFTGHLLL